jgi:gluconolactonase
MVYGKGLLLVGAVSILLGSGARENLPLLVKSGAGSAQIHASGAQVKLEKLDPALDQIVPSDARLEQVADGFKWTEGPVWIPAGYLMFAEIPSNSIRRLASDSHVSIFMQPSGYKGTAPYFGLEPGSNGMTLDRQGRLTVAGHAQRDVWRLESLDPHAPRTILADSYQGKKLNSPNDLVYKSDGSLYFTDPPYGIRTKSDQYPGKELKINGVYRIPAAAAQPAGSEPRRSQLQLLVSDLNRPNGIAFSPDEHFLYVDSTTPQKIWMRYPVKADGTLGKGEVFFDATSDNRVGAPDGMKVDTKGNIYSAGPGGIWIFSPAGKHLGTILLPKSAGNVAWGDSDGRTLYIAMSDSILKIRLSIPGILPGRGGHVGG